MTSLISLILPKLNSALNSLPIQKFAVAEDSMRPALRPGDSVVIWRGTRARVGDVVVAKIGNKHYVKRISRSLGDKVYLLGDNPGHSVDSRNFGWVERSKIVGRVFFVKRFDEGE